MKEIGSDFWLSEDIGGVMDDKLPSFLNLGVDNKLLLSGRTAIDFVLRDILQSREIESVYFPAYCCQSMMQPFIDHGIRIMLYDVHFDDFDKKLEFRIDTTLQCDIFFAVNYFGFKQGRMDFYIENFKNKNSIVIEDSTQSILSYYSHNSQSDYVIASLRKWFPIISGGLAAKTSKQFEIGLKDVTFEEMVRVRKSAMLQKEKYINSEINTDKKSYLKKYSNANEMLNNDYILYAIDRESYNIMKLLDLESIIKRRKENTRLLYDNLPMNKGFSMMFPDIENGDCPIFLPLIFNSNTERDKLREYLISKNVFCPIHWPKPFILNKQGNTTNINKNELSIVVDQRYDVTDMQYLIRRVIEYYE